VTTSRKLEWALWLAFLVYVIVSVVVGAGCL
jgi:hypothetical protein